ncbi:hypothetical protein K5X77_04695 [Vagococcus lutrae]|uniref:hypothetical protein n=1 Tax=Vagococcus lutrae TaxID=81947 RepID=UPI001C96FDFD|nr:hypothetical protein [Vagococcus lutrae]MDO5742324.1 hypothetical protein [Vagococcus sp.]MDT2811553.1 hypothetical protein [Vagococcus lutrae]QZN89586.1 hypothetical protein K5X77_04695 [Vagococcus lutrae]
MKKKLMSQLLLASVFCQMGAVSVLAEEFDPNIDEDTSEVLFEVEGGRLYFTERPSQTASMDFGKVSYKDLVTSGKTLTPKNNAEIKISDYRGNQGDMWELKVNDRYDDYEYYGMTLKINPQLLEGETHSLEEELEINDETQYVAVGYPHESTISLNPSLIVPQNINARDYSTVLEWTLEGHLH